MLAVNLPSVPVTDLHIHQGSEYLYAATYGRSSYKINITENILASPNQDPTTTITVSPNPAEDIVVISFTHQAQEIAVTIYDALGRKMLSRSLAATLDKATLEVSELPRGLYYLRLDIAGVRTTKKLIKK